MNRALIFGIAIFFAVVGIALIGGESKAVAGHGCHGCDGVGCDGGCGGHVSDCCGCHGRRKLFGHRRNRGCCGCDGAPSCCGQAPVCAPACAAPACPPSCAGVAPACPPSCAGEVPHGAPAPSDAIAPPPAPKGASVKSIRTPMVSYRR